MVPARWRPPPLIANPRLRWGLYALGLAYLVAAVATVEIDWARLAQGVERGWRFVAAFLAPDFLTRWRDIAAGVLESLAMTAIATVVGVALAIPVGYCAARNLVPLPVYLAARACIGLSRTFPEIIIAIVLVAMFGFGPFAGFLTLAFASIGFIGKLLAEEIEACDRQTLEAMRATGAGWFTTLLYAVHPQVKPRLIGLALYRLDINFRESAIIGVVGAGGIGDTLATTFDRYEYASSAAILLIIIGIVLACEYASGFIRKRFI